MNAKNYEFIVKSATIYEISKIMQQISSVNILFHMAFLFHSQQRDWSLQYMFGNIFSLTFLVFLVMYGWNIYSVA